MTDNISPFPNSAPRPHSNYSSALLQDQEHTLTLILPGIAGKIADHLYNNSIYPDHGACTIAALAAIAAVAGHQNYSPTGLKLNLYTGFIMPSGFGKDRIKDGVFDVLELCRFHDRIVSPMASRQALHRELNSLEIENLIKHNQWSSDDARDKAEEAIKDGQGIPITAVMVADEFHSILQVDEKSPHKLERRDMLLEAYSSKKALRGVKSIANPLPPITQCHFNLIGFSTPGEMIRALGNNSAGSGLAGRFLFYTLRKRPEKNYRNMVETPLSLTGEEIQTLRDISGYKHRVVNWTERAFSYWVDLDRRCIEPMKDDDEGGEIANRLSEHVIKIASLLALCINPNKPEIDVAQIDQAWQLRHALHANFVSMLSSEGGLGSSIEASTATKIEKRIFQATRMTGAVSRSRFSQLCADFRRLTTQEQKSVLERLQLEGKIFVADTGRGQSIQWVETQQ